MLPPPGAGVRVDERAGERVTRGGDYVTAAV